MYCFNIYNNSSIIGDWRGLMFVDMYCCKNDIFWQKDRTCTLIVLSQSFISISPTS